MKAKTIRGKSPEEIKNALEQAVADGFKPTLAFVFVTLRVEWQKIRDLLDKKGIAVFGAKTAMPFDDKSSFKEGFVIMLLDINPKYFRIVLRDNTQGSLSESVTQICTIGKNSFSSPAFLISVADVSNPGDKIMEKFVKEIGDNITISGAYSGDTETWNGNIFTNDSFSNNGIIALILDGDKIDVKGTAVSGWRAAVGTKKTVTKSEGIWLYTIDNQPAFDVLKKFVGDVTIGEDSTHSIVKLDTSTYVLQAERDGDSPAYFATLEYNTKNGAIKCSSPIPEGTTFRFALPPDFEVVDDVIETSVKTKENELPEADALIIFSCIGRIITLGPMAEDEIKGLAQTWGKPAAGFFSLGEFGRVEGGRPEYHATTCSWVALKET